MIVVTGKKPRLAIVSPTVDKRHGTERYVAEWVSRLAGRFEIHLYSQQVEDLDLASVHWHRISKIPGPHLLNYLWWFGCNRIRRAWDKRVRGLRYDLIYSPGINCFDADVISVHIVFAELLRKNSSNELLSARSVWSLQRILHRQMYYRFIAYLERRIYTNRGTSLILITPRTAESLQRFYGRCEPLPSLYFGLDHGTFNPQRRCDLRDAARRELELLPEQFVLLLVGNGWQNKGLPTIVKAMGRLKGLPLCLIVVGSDDPSPYQAAIQDNSLVGRVRFMPPRSDIEFYYSVADVYVGPSTEDVLPLPPAEAMACGVPVIVSSSCGISEIIRDGEDGFILGDPSDADDLAVKTRKLYENASLRMRLCENAISVVRPYTWERNTCEFAAILAEVIERKKRLRVQVLHFDS